MKGARVIVISSVSGGGKTTIIRELLKLHPDKLMDTITTTSRPARQGEKDGVDYYFMSPEEFRAGLEKGEFLEHAEVHGNLYGVPKAPVLSGIEAGKSVILNIDVQGMRSVKEQLGDLVFTIFIMPPDLDVWEERLRGRKTESEEDIRKRLQRGALELEAAFEYDYRIVNNELAVAIEEVLEVLQKEGAL